MGEVVIGRRTFGRTPIFTAETEITDENIISVMNKAVPIFNKNAAECEYLYNYYKGRQPILDRIKFERPEICNMIVENRAYEIVTFKTGRFLYKNILYTNRSEKNVEEVDALNRVMYTEGKAGKDRQLVDWFHICGHAYRMVVDAPREDGTPFHVYTIEPRRAFVVYSDTVDQKPLLGVYKTTTLDDKKQKHTTYTAYTDKKVYTIINNQIIGEPQEHLLGGVPIVEYPANYARLGCFEVVIPLLDAINLAQSNRLDGVEQFIQALLVFKGLDMENDDIASLRREGAICLPKDTDMDYLTNELNQSQTQTLVDDMYQAVLTICGMPNRNGGSSTSDNKGAVVLRDGWSSAATAVKETKQYFESAERRMLTMALKVFNVYRDSLKERNELTLGDVDIHFDEGEYENTLEKAQVLAMLLAQDYVHPRNAYEFSNITSDPEAAYLAGKAYHDEVAAKELAAMQADTGYTTETDGLTNNRLPSVSVVNFSNGIEDSDV